MSNIFNNNSLSCKLQWQVITLLCHVVIFLVKRVEVHPKDYHSTVQCILNESMAYI